ncbi:DUF5134 domain-containing protein [Streptomyces sp. NRRL S-37]|uniref:DUF5134 domain-containing protein n=1 Tax=Streptomyces sp. NRRL S-37 TaxID=1463903 RepID=UPI0004CBE22B|nr:DUF5134 domain-containing protein [Streptomyces sp. NRRL S-37]
MHHAALSGVPGWLLGALCAAVGAYCLLRARTGPRAERAEMTGDALMGFGMAAMAPPSLMTALPGWSGTVFGAHFAAVGLAALAFPGPLRRRLHHVVGALAMVHMSLAMSTGGHHTAGAGVPVLTGALLAYFTVYVLRTGAALVPAGPADASGRPPHLALLLGRACRVAMAVAMLTMLAAL